MTDEQLKLLTEMTLLNDARIEHISGILSRLIKRELDTAKTGSTSANPLQSLQADFKRLEALAIDAEVERDWARRLFQPE